jgi:hypothetical protein
MFDLTQLSEWLQPIRWPLTAAYLASLALLCLYGLHRYWLTATFYRTRDRTPRIARRFDELPRVTMQLPMYNEPFVAERRHRVGLPGRLPGRPAADTGARRLRRRRGGNCQSMC